jgi:hypothetical protein
MTGRPHICLVKVHCLACRLQPEFRRRHGLPDVCDIPDPPPDPAEKCGACTNMDCQLKPLTDCRRRTRLRAGFDCPKIK